MAIIEEDDGTCGFGLESHDKMRELLFRGRNLVCQSICNQTIETTGAARIYVDEVDKILEYFSKGDK